MPIQITENSIKKTIYTDFMDNFDIHPVTGDLVLLTNEDSVRASIRHIVLTMFFERPFQPFLGTTILHELFENYTTVTQTNTIDSIKNAIVNNEDRIGYLDVYFNGQPDENQIAVTIIFTIINSSNKISLNVPLYRVR